MHEINKQRNMYFLLRNITICGTVQLFFFTHCIAPLTLTNIFPLYRDLIFT